MRASTSWPTVRARLALALTLILTLTLTLTLIRLRRLPRLAALHEGLLLLPGEANACTATQLHLHLCMRLLPEEQTSCNPLHPSTPPSLHPSTPPPLLLLPGDPRPDGAARPRDVGQRPDRLPPHLPWVCPRLRRHLLRPAHGHRHGRAARLRHVPAPSSLHGTLIRPSRAPF